MKDTDPIAKTTNEVGWEQVRFPLWAGAKPRPSSGTLRLHVPAILAKHLEAPVDVFLVKGGVLAEAFWKVITNSTNADLPMLIPEALEWIVWNFPESQDERFRLAVKDDFVEVFGAEAARWFVWLDARFGVDPVAVAGAGLVQAFPRPPRLGPS